MKNQSSDLSIDSIRKGRTLAGLQFWIKQVLKFYNANEESRNRFRLDNSQPFKKFREEVLSVASFLERLSVDENLCVIFPADNLPLDAIVFRNKNDALMRLEAVTAVDGYDNRLRMELLTLAGNAPGHGPIVREKETGRIVAHNRAVSSEEVFKKILTLIDVAIRKKDEKRYPPHTWLLVSVFDSILIDDFVPCLIPAVQANGYVTQFERVYLVGQSEHNRLLGRVDALG